MDTPLCPSLSVNREALAQLLRWPRNLGVEFRSFGLQAQSRNEGLVLFIRGLADEERIRQGVLEPLQRLSLRQRRDLAQAPAGMANLLPAPYLQEAVTAETVAKGVLAGATAVLLDGYPRAFLVGTTGPMDNPAGSAASINPSKEVFGADLLQNISLIRKRLQDPALVAYPVAERAANSGQGALVFLEGLAAPDLVHQIEQWLTAKGGVGALHKGAAAGLPGKLGLPPTLLSMRWPDKAAMLLGEGYVLLLADRLPYGYVAPVTTGALVAGPGDPMMRRPILLALRATQMGFILVTAMAPALVVAIIGYHQEMMPTPFMLALASKRENAALPFIAEVTFLAVLQEMLREAAARLPITLPAGSALVAEFLLLLLLVQTGLVGPLPAVVSAIVAIASLALPSYDIIYMSRITRFWLLASAGTLGIFGMAVAAFLICVWLVRASSFGRPFFSETGIQLATIGRLSSAKEGSK